MIGAIITLIVNIVIQEFMRQRVAVIVLVGQIVIASVHVAIIMMMVSGQRLLVESVM
jgi:hypothetical protein